MPMGITEGGREERERKAGREGRGTIGG